MSKTVKKCCVPGCTDKQAKRHRIPTNEVISGVWLQRINNPKLTAEGTLLTSYRICDIHFEETCKNPNGKLMKPSLPTLHLPSYQKSGDDIFWVQEQQASFSTPKKLKESIAALSSSATICTRLSPIQAIKKPIVVYPGKRLLQAVKEEPCSSSSKILDELSTSVNVDLIEEIPSTPRQLVRHKRVRTVTGVGTVTDIHHCSFCKAKDEEVQLWNCDGCKTKICQPCTKLTTSEIKCMELKKNRQLYLLCQICKDKLQDYMVDDRIKKHLATIKDEIGSELKNTLKKYQDIIEQQSNLINKLTDDIKECLQKKEDLLPNCTKQDI